MDLLQDTQKQYRRIFSGDPEIVVRAPGRVNLIGEHTDYNNGFVLPVAIDRSVTVAAGRRNDRRLHLHALDPGTSVIADLTALSLNTSLRWSNYPLGVADRLLKRGCPIRGGNYCFRGNIPIGSGLSSSAALEVAFAVAMLKLNSIEMPDLDLIRVAQEAEQEFVGVHCGIMDQFVSVMGKRDHALFLDCRDLSFSLEAIPARASVVVCDNGMRRSLSSSAYNTRREECEKAAELLGARYPEIRSLRDLTPDRLESARTLLPPVLLRRAQHVVTENERVRKSVDALRAGDLHRFGDLLYTSHESLSARFEVSTPELDALVSLARTVEGVYGARMTGAGFGGCAICLVADEHLPSFQKEIRDKYRDARGVTLRISLTKPVDGASYLLPGHSPDLIAVATRS